MLWEWGAVNDGGLGDAAGSSAPSRGSQPAETDEAREGRLRSAYAEALQLHADRRVAEARDTYQALAVELAASASASGKREGYVAQEQTRVRKRPRGGTSREAAEWTRVMRYAVRRNLGDVLVEQGEHRAAMDAYAAALDDDPDDMPVWLRAGRAAMACGHLHVARRALEEALRRRPEHWRCVDEYRRVLIAIGDADEDVPATERGTNSSARWRLPTGLSEDVPSSEGIANVVGARYLHLLKEKEASLAAAGAVDSVQIADRTWMAIVVALASVLKRRLVGANSNRFAVGDAIQLDVHWGGEVMENITDASSKKEESDISELQRDSQNGNAQTADASALGTSEPFACARSGSARGEPNGSDAAALGASTSGLHEESSNTPVNVVANDTLVEDAKQASVDEKSDALPANSIGKSQEVRKSRRQLELGREQRRDHLRSADTQDGPDHERSLSWNISEHMLRFLPDLPLSWSQSSEISEASDNSIVSNQECAAEIFSDDTRMDDQFANVTPGVVNTRWNHAWSEADESAEVSSFVRGVAESPNGGPLDLLHRVMTVLLGKVSVQYMPQIARTWLLLQPHFAEPSPRSLALTMFVVESLLVSGDKTGKNKRACFDEAKHLVAIMQDFTRSAPTADVTTETCSLAMQARSAWVSSQLAERTNEVQSGFLYALRCTRALKRIRDLGIEQLPFDAGPLLGGMSIESAVTMVRQEGAFLYNAIELESAKSCLSNAKKLQDPALARSAVQILTRSVRAVARRLDLDLCGVTPNSNPMASSGIKHSTEDHRVDSVAKIFAVNIDNDGKALPNMGSKCMATISSQLEVYQSACSCAGDDAGELAALAIRAKILIIQHNQLESTHSARNDRRGRDPVRLPSLCPGGAAEKISCVVAILRKFVASIKKVTGMHYTRCEHGASAWSSSAAACYAAKALIAVSHVLASQIPPVGRSLSTPLELSVAEKNQRLAFTRAVLGFVRCVAFVVQGEEEESSCGMEPQKPSRLSTSRILDALLFSLQVLAPRGCVREEGTSGALIRLYLYNLSQRLRELSIAHMSQEATCGAVFSGDNGITSSSGLQTHSLGRECASGDARDSGKEDGDKVGDGTGSMSGDESENLSDEFSPLNWDDVSTLRREMAQCYRCLYKLPDLEVLLTNDGVEDSRWLMEACSLSRRVGLSFAADAAPVKTHLDIEACLGAFGFYRKYLFEALACQWRDGKKSRRARDVIVEIATSLPAEFPTGVPCIPLPALDSVVSLGLENGRAAVTALKDDWDKAVSRADQEREDLSTVLKCAQLSRMYHEIYILHMMTILTSYESEFKKQRVVERRKAPKEVVERLINAASNDCIGALRARPWSPGAWILLGRVVLEVADVALDERAVASSTFGLCRGEDLASGDLGDPAVAILGRAEGCFRLAEALAKEMWIPNHLQVVNEAVNDGMFDAEAFDTALKSSSTSRDGKDAFRSPLPFDLFAQFGLEEGRGGARSVRAAAQFGKASVLMMKLREERYRTRHWCTSTIVPRPLSRGSERFPDHVNQLALDALRSLEKGLRVSFPDSSSSATQSAVGKGVAEVLNLSIGEDSRLTGDDDSTIPLLGHAGALPQRSMNAISSILWYYMMMRAKLFRKRGEDPKVYVPLFADAMEENKKSRSGDAEKFDIEPFYQLHVTRLKVLLEHDGADWKGICNMLMQSAFEKGPSAVDAGVEFVTGEKSRPVAQLHIAMRHAVGEDIGKAMTHCRQLRGSHPYSEFHFKSVYAKALIHWKIFNDPKRAIEDLNTLFRSEAAAKAIDPGSDGAHRGYFFTIWNYRYTDTGFEVALETERKYLRWRDKLLGLFAAILRDMGDLRKLTGIISRLKRRHPDDLPIDGAVLDDIAGARAEVSMKQVLKFAETVKEKPTVALSEWLFHNAWDVFVETCRLTQGVKRARLHIEREAENMCGALAIGESDRPWCVAVAVNSLHLEHIRLQAAIAGNRLERSELQRYLCANWTSELLPEAQIEFATTIKLCLKRWPVDPKVAKLIRRRVDNYESGVRIKDTSKELDRKPGSADRVGTIGPSSFRIGVTNDLSKGKDTGLEKEESSASFAHSKKVVCETIDLERGSCQ
jgi:hypothetical protein